ncbi:uncharacterized protein N7459_000519 [Penicillium hispanicum]|uniref:uncharacterized protein n=1 Tax=Penicillium hispanicum TaxID=1080232 RepID=UPI002540BAB5|nr:uncharacterized protein N7459_000519 [Penicillium hispanicum]KAJ5594311.1 hypothetical protein N7459_000519 [Penicillium hispanicum]
MATEDDNFDIDIYGDGGDNTNDQGDYKQDDSALVLDAPETGTPVNNIKPATESKPQTEHAPSTNGGHPVPHQLPPVPGASAPHGVKRKEYDDRPSDPDATTALLISDLSWWTTDDDIRGWVNQAQSEDELKDVTFSEHKVNGKSKGQAFVEFTTPKAATALKHLLETGAQSGRKYMVNYTNPHTNPFRTLPKDAPMRKEANRGGMSGGFTPGGNQNMNFGSGMNMGGGYRGGRGGYNNRGMGNMGNFNNRNNFNNMGGFQPGGGPMMGGFQGGFQGGMQNYGFNNRGGMMGGGMRGGPGGMRGGRGGNMGANNMMGMPAMNAMGGMGMNPMAGSMGPMMGGMGMQGQGFQGPNPAFNQGFFNNQGGGGDASWNPHGAKRSRQE